MLNGSPSHKNSKWWTSYYILVTAKLTGILNRQSRAERQNTFDWLHILPVRVIISQNKIYSANISHILPARVTIRLSQYKSRSANNLPDNLPDEASPADTAQPL